MGMIEGELVKNLENKLEQLSQEISKLDLLLKKPKRFAVHRELSNKKEGNVRERELMGRRIKEFNSAMEYILDYLNSDVKVLMLKGPFDWNKIYWMIKREYRRLEDGLPIYAHRKDILSQIHCQQVMVLIGETDSRKSTQMVWLLADS